jgi:hypothetical protein
MAKMSNKKPKAAVARLGKSLRMGTGLAAGFLLKDLHGKMVDIGYLRNRVKEVEEITGIPISIRYEPSFGGYFLVYLTRKKSKRGSEKHSAKQV